MTSATQPTPSVYTIDITNATCLYGLRVTLASAPQLGTFRVTGHFHQFTGEVFVHLIRCDTGERYVSYVRYVGLVDDDIPEFCDRLAALLNPPHGR